MDCDIVRSSAVYSSGPAVFGKVALQKFSANVIREEETSWTRSALRSVMFHRKLLHFFLAARDKAVVRLSEAEDSGAPVKTVEAFCTPNGAWFPDSGTCSNAEKRAWDFEQLHRRLMIVGEKCAANLGLTDGFRMAVRYPPSGPSDYRTRLCILGGRQLGQPPG
ncbi:adenosine 5'-monophosphoramidase HINT1-like [Lagopus muta]|uniref:adenosine 5'-monophosphoramidase HINT1-like n=1 Tax=Lagopus muta TaxID=64668 RepID=UPI0020A07FC8|nr:adenosine 5'-monophosphoramidase HINT1-like [Lagopus muta]